MFRLALVAVVLLLGSSAHADPYEVSEGIAHELAADAVFTPGMLRARDGGKGFVVAATEWSGASDRVRLDVLGEARVLGPVRLVVKVADAFRDSARPGIGAGVKWLDETKHGVGSTAYLFYKTEGFSEPEGELEAVVAFGRTLGAVRASLDLAYGQDPEGNERDGELAVAAQLEPRRGLFTGVVGRYRDALGSRKEAVVRDGFGGLSATLAAGRFGVTGMAGVAMIETQLTGTAVGPAATLAIGAAF
jgi:hypothetical protein